MPKILRKIYFVIYAMQFTERGSENNPPLYIQQHSGETFQPDAVTI